MRGLWHDISPWLVWASWVVVVLGAAGWSFYAGYRLAQIELLGG